MRKHRAISSAMGYLDALTIKVEVGSVLADHIAATQNSMTNSPTLALSATIRIRIVFLTGCTCCHFAEHQCRARGRINFAVVVMLKNVDIAMRSHRCRCLLNQTSHQRHPTAHVRRIEHGNRLSQTAQLEYLRVIKPGGAADQRHLITLTVRNQLIDSVGQAKINDHIRWSGQFSQTSVLV